MGLSRCRVSYTDQEGIEHAVEVHADSLYEAAALAVCEFREQELDTDGPKPMTLLTITVYRKPVEHKIHVQQVREWAKPSTEGGPAGIMRRDRIRRLLGIGES